MHPFFSYAPADDRVPVGSDARFGFVSLLRFNLSLSLARRGVVIASAVRGEPGGASVDEGEARGASLFGRLLRGHRVAAGLSQEALAERAQVSINGLSALERGRRRTPQRETLALLVQALALDPADRDAFETAARREPRMDLVPEPPGPSVNDLERSDLLIVILTPAWYADDTCREHVTRFMTRAGEASGTSDVILVRRDPFAIDRRVESFIGRPVFDFFRGASDVRPFEPLYRNDGKPDIGFYDAVDMLAETICSSGSSPGAVSHVVAPPAPVVFVAPPASDMEMAYRTLVAELAASGYRVVPAPGREVRLDEAGLAEIDEDLSRADASIHLLGDVDQTDPEGRSRLGTILERAGARPVTNGADFRRIVYAPKFLASTDDGAIVHERDPIAVRDRFVGARPGDTVLGYAITDFILTVKSLVAAAARRDAPSTAPAQLPSGSTVFLNFHPSDLTYARALSKALRERGVRARIAAFEDDKIQNRITNAGLVRDSDGIVHCWANASDAWLYAEASDYKDWRDFGRAQPFNTRAAVAGPPKRGSKEFYSADDPPEAIDVYVDLTAYPIPTAAHLDPIVASVERRTGA